MEKQMAETFKLSQILDSVRYGDDFVSSRNMFEDLESYYNKDYGLFLYEDRIASLMEDTYLQENNKVLLDKMVEEIKDVHEKYIYEGSLTQAYRKIKADTVLSNLKKFRDGFNNLTLAESKKYDFDVIGKIIGTAYHAYTDIIKYTDFEPKTLTKTTINKINESLVEEFEDLNNYLEE